MASDMPRLRITRGGGPFSMSCPGAFSGGRRKTGMKAANDAQMRGECRLIGERWAQDREENGGNRLSRANAPTFLSSRNSCGAASFGEQRETTYGKNTALYERR